jgi:hypothetical protein
MIMEHNFARRFRPGRELSETDELPEQGKSSLILQVRSESLKFVTSHAICFIR